MEEDISIDTHSLPAGQTDQSPQMESAHSLLPTDISISQPDWTAIDNLAAEIGKSTQRIIFSGYESISNEEFSSNSFSQLYQNDFIVDGQIVPSSSDIIIELARKMGKTQKAAYLQVKRKFIEQVKHQSTADPPKQHQSAADPLEQQRSSKRKVVAVPVDAKKVESVNSVDDNSESCDPSGDVESFVQTFEIEDNAIFEIERHKTLHRGKFIDKKKVKSGWASKLAFFLFKEAELRCKFDFKNAWTTKDGKISTIAKCECNSSASVSYHNNRLSVEVKNISQHFPHKRTYQIRGEFKQNFLQKLEHNTAQAVQMKHINELNPDNEKIDEQFNPYVPTLNAIRLLNSRSRKKEADPIDTLLEWKDSIFQNVICAIGISPFYIFFRTPLQLAWYLIESKKRSISISIDATGSLITPPNRSQKIEGSDKLKHVFLYTIMAKTSTKSVPIAQMISQDQTTEFIMLFLKKTFKDLIPPREIVCDEGKALLKALSGSFANLESTADFIACCMSSLLKGTEPPKCIIRIDRSHFVHKLAMKIKYRDFRKQNLFRGVFGYLMQCDSFQTAKKIILDFFTVILNENDGVDEFGVALPSEEARNRLVGLRSTHDDIDYASVSDDSLEEEDPEKDMNFNADSGWINDIIKDVPIKNSDNYHASVYYSERDKITYVKLLASIPLWSNIMNQIFESTTEVATSSDVESYFKSLKSGILGRKLRRADDFFEIYTEFVNAEIKLNAISNTKNDLESPPSRKRSNSLHERPFITPGK